MKGVLTLIPTPIDDQSQILPATKEILEAAILNKDLILVEELKPCRRKWLHFGLPREAIEDFVQYNEHSRKELAPKMLQELKKGRNIFLMSDCGLPAFCDPGAELVNLCHQSKIKVTSASFSNSIALAVALSGFPHNQFVFEGFLTNKSEIRTKELKRIMNEKRMSILMDTPYRLNKILAEMQTYASQREIFIGMDLNCETEELLRGSAESIAKKIGKQKREFILIIGPEIFGRTK